MDDGPEPSRPPKMATNAITPNFVKDFNFFCDISKSITSIIVHCITLIHTHAHTDTHRNECGNNFSSALSAISCYIYSNYNFATFKLHRIAIVIQFPLLFFVCICVCVCLRVVLLNPSSSFVCTYMNCMPFAALPNKIPETSF